MRVSMAVLRSWSVEVEGRDSSKWCERPAMRKRRWGAVWAVDFLGDLEEDMVVVLCLCLV